MYQPNHEANVINQYSQKQQQKRDEQQFNLFKVGAAGLATAGLARLLFGNRGS